jgi:heme-degrading monooxygenase HmoA
MGAFIGCLRTQDVCCRAIASNASSIPAFTTMSIIVPSAIEPMILCYDPPRTNLPDYASCDVLRPSGRGDPLMFIAMNRFRVAKGSEAAFEQVWKSRDSHLEKVPGFVEFHLLKGPEAEDHTLYASHTIWENRATFEAWTRSEAFRAAHNRAGDNKSLYLDHPQFEGFEVRQTVGRGRTA